MHIAYLEGNQELVASVAPGLTAQQAAEAMGLSPGTWREITDAEAAALQAPTLAEARTAKLSEVMSAYQAAFAPIEDVYPAAEREGWPIQETEARAVLADPKAKTPVLSMLIEMRGKKEKVKDLAAKILENATTWATVYAVLTGQQQRMYVEVSALGAVEAVQAYPVEYRMPGAG